VRDDQLVFSRDALARMAGVPLAAALLIATPHLRSAAGQEAVSPSDAIVLVRTINTLRSTRGSGFVVGDGSWVVTASHVVSVDLGKGRRASDQTVLVYSPWTGRPSEAKVVAVDGVADIALLRLPRPGYPALPVERLEDTDAVNALAALKDRPLRLFGFPLTYGESTVAALARPEHNDSRLREIAKRGETNLCVLNPCPDAQPGWSGGPVVSLDRGAVVAVFHSLYQKGEGDPGVPAGSLSGYLTSMLSGAGVADPKSFAAVKPPAFPRAPRAAELMASEMRSLAWSAAGNWKKAEDEQNEILALQPEDVPARVERGRLLLARQKFRDAVTVLRDAVQRDPKSMLAHLTLGRALHQDYDPKGAIAELRAAVAASPGEVEPQLVLARVFEDNQKPDDAEKVLRQAMSDAPENPVVVFRLGTLLAQTAVGQKVREEEGMKLLAKAAGMCGADPVLSFIPVGYGRSLEERRQWREAEAAYRQAQKTDPENAGAYYYLSLLFLRQKRVEDAQIQLNAGIRIKSISEDMLEAFRALQVRINEKG
jgi:tetratricopeptide (TPR) repeat protein